MEHRDSRLGDIGLGIGLDYGGVAGIKATLYPISRLGVFLAGGWEMVDFGWNIGVLARLFPADGRRVVRPYLKLMYGVNGFTKVSGDSSYDKVFFGVTPGLGMEARFGVLRQSGLNVDLNVPIRSGEFFDQVNKMKNDPGIVKVSPILPIAISVGYHYEF